MDRVNRKNRLVAAVIHHIQHYNPDTYWKMRNVVISSRGGYCIKSSSISICSELKEWMRLTMRLWELI